MPRTPEKRGQVRATRKRARDEEEDDGLATTADEQYNDAVAAASQRQADNANGGK